jgi:hypothetical protein
LQLFRYKVCKAVKTAAITPDIINDNPNNSELGLGFPICGVPDIVGFGSRIDGTSLNNLLKPIGL